MVIKMTDLFCKSCTNLYSSISNRLPYVLPCGCSVCGNCVESLPGRISCPVCGVGVSFSKNEKFPKNSALLRIAESAFNNSRNIDSMVLETYIAISAKHLENAASALENVVEFSQNIESFTTVPNFEEKMTNIRKKFQDFKLKCQKAESNLFPQAEIDIEPIYSFLPTPKVDPSLIEIEFEPKLQKIIKF